MKSLTVLTPCFNSEQYIAETVASVAEAARRCDVVVDYILCDGASSDRTVSLARSTAESFQLPMRVISQPDRGMYDALRKGFPYATGDFVSYLNAGDTYFPGAFDVVHRVTTSLPQVRWCTGFPTILASDGVTIVSVQPPWVYRRQLILEGWYGGRLPFISQEPTFFARTLLDTVDMAYFASLQLAGDGYLWHSFAASGAELYAVDACLAGFRLHAGQLSSSRKQYFDEKAEFALRRRPRSYALAFFDLVAWKFLPQGIKRRYAPRYVGHEFRDESRWRLSVKKMIDY